LLPLRRGGLAVMLNSLPTRVGGERVASIVAVETQDARLDARIEVARSKRLETRDAR